MIKVMVVDDEPFILRTIVRMIEQSEGRFKVIAEAMNGELALQMMEARGTPDILFTDIRMPVMDGLQLIERLRAMDSEAIPVVLSSYQEFEYARRACHLGVYDYLSKPLDPAILQDRLEDLRRRVEAKRRERQYRALKSLLLGGDIPVPGLFPAGDYYALLAVAGSYLFQPAVEQAPSETFWLETAWEAEFEARLPGTARCWIADGNRGNEKMLLLSVPRGSGDEGTSTGTAEEIVERVHRLLNRTGMPVTIVATALEDLSALPQVARRLQVRLSKSVIFGRPSRQWLERASESTQPAASAEARDGQSGVYDEKLLRTIIRSKRADALIAELGRVFGRLEAQGCRQLELEQVLRAVLTLLDDAVGRPDPEPLGKARDAELWELIGGTSSYTALYDELRAIVEARFRSEWLRQSRDQDDHRSLVEKIDRYILSNFEQQINLQSLSEQFGLVPSYLSRIYKNAKGLSPTNRIIQLRVEQARKLLTADPDMTMQEIAKLVGFNDPYYFSKIFKSVTGKAPSDYRAAPQ